MPHDEGHPQDCGCDDCAERAYWRSLGPAPTEHALLRHAQRFGPEGVVETGRAYGLDPKVPRGAHKHPPRRSRKSRRRRVPQTA